MSNIGDVLSSSNGAGVASISSCNIDGTPVSGVDPMGYTSTSKYDSNGHLVSANTTKPLNIAGINTATADSSYIYNNDGSIQSVSQGDYSIAYVYISTGAPKTVTYTHPVQDGNSRTYIINYVYDPISGQLVKKFDDHNNSETYSYGANGLDTINFIYNGNKGQINYKYDALGRVSEIDRSSVVDNNISKGINTYYTYDNYNSLASIQVGGTK